MSLGAVEVMQMALVSWRLSISRTLLALTMPLKETVQSTSEFESLVHILLICD